MSALAGIFKFDPRNVVHESDLVALAEGIRTIGPDGGGSINRSNLGMAYRALHSTPESRFESQPLDRPGSTLTWDGRLDNRDEIRETVSEKFERIPTDVELVSAAYREWGTKCFSRLLGDWAIALWDDDRKQLILANDYIGVRRLFYRVDDDGVSWCTVPEPLVLLAPAKLHLNLDYFSGCFHTRPPLGTTPYREIRGVTPAHFLIFRLGGQIEEARYWSINPNAIIRHSSDEGYEEEFRAVLRRSVCRRIRADGIITAELSGGVDSSSIVCIADDIRRAEVGPAIETLSYYNLDEPSGDERPFFSVIEQYRGRTGDHISMDKVFQQLTNRALAPLPKEHFLAAPGYFMRSLAWSRAIQEVLERSGSRVVLSGLGGDELLGGVQYEAPELAEYLVEGKIGLFCRALIAWSVSRKKTVYRLLREAFGLLMSRYNPSALVSGSTDHCRWVRLSPPNSRKIISHFTNWNKLGPTQANAEGVRYSIASQLACTDPPLTGEFERRYPYLDRDVFEFVAAVPRNQIVSPNLRRSLMRRSLKDLVPHQVLFRKTKWFGSRSPLAELRDQMPYLHQMFDTHWLSDGILIDAGHLLDELGNSGHGPTTPSSHTLLAISIEQWLRDQVDRGLLDMKVPP